jgi:rubrerythrin
VSNPKITLEEALKGLPLNASKDDLIKMPKAKLINCFAIALQITKTIIAKMQEMAGEMQKLEAIKLKQLEVIDKMKDEMLKLEAKLAATEVTAVAGGLASSFDSSKYTKYECNGCGHIWHSKEMQTACPHCMSENIES